MNFLIAIYRRFFPAPDTAKLVCKLDKTVCKLNSLAANKLTEARTYREQRAALLDRVDAAEQEADLAQRVARKIADLIN